MRKYLIITILIAALGFVACENTIRYEYDPSDGKITILGQLSTTNTKHTLFLSMSYPDRIDSLPGAKVECFVNGARSVAKAIPAGYTEELVNWQTGETMLVPNRFPYTQYEFEANFKPGDKVRIEASKGNLNAWTELVVPKLGTIMSVDTATVVKSFVYQDIDGTDTYEQEYLEFTLRLRDVQGEDNYYSMNGNLTTVTSLSSDDEGETRVDTEGPYWLDYETFHDLILEDGYSSGMGELFEDMVPVNSTHCFSDKLFKDSEATVRFYIPSYYFKNYYYFFYDADRIEINRFFRLSMKSFDRSFYNYLRALNNMDTYGYDVSPIIEPTMLPNNVNGGMGIVSIAAESTVEMIFEPFVYYKEDSYYPIYY
ncbi:MAG: DUF4249 domain-containing protein [Bacteroidales bacterium]|nr:DUF4249 domain-containing protein [Bacteroidales bacterium]